MTNHAPTDDGLLPCPFCGLAMTVMAGNKFNPYARCDTEGCFAARGPVVNLDNPKSVADWNTRASAQRSGVGEPVAWRYRFVTSTDRDWSDWFIVDDRPSIPHRDPADVEIQPLYDCPPSETGHGQSEVPSADAIILGVRETMGSTEEADIDFVLEQLAEAVNKRSVIKSFRRQIVTVAASEAASAALATRPADTSKETNDDSKNLSVESSHGRSSDAHAGDHGAGDARECTGTISSGAGVEQCQERRGLADRGQHLGSGQGIDAPQLTADTSEREVVELRALLDELRPMTDDWSNNWSGDRTRHEVVMLVQKRMTRFLERADAILAALPVASSRSADVAEGSPEDIANRIIADPKVLWLRECGFQSAARFESELKAAIMRALTQPSAKLGGEA